MRSRPLANGRPGFGIAEPAPKRHEACRFLARGRVVRRIWSGSKGVSGNLCIWWPARLPLRSLSAADGLEAILEHEGKPVDRCQPPSDRPGGFLVPADGEVGQLLGSLLRREGTPCLDGLSDQPIRVF